LNTSLKHTWNGDSQNMNSTNTLSTGMLAGFAIIGLLLGVAVLTLYGAWAGAFVATHLWAWYVMPAFGVASLKMIHAFGIFLLINFWTYHHRSQYIKDERTGGAKATEILMLMAYPWMVLLFGWLGVVLFM
jgi:disulfide bond formation protein DsbB